MSFFVIPAKAGIQYIQSVTKPLDPVFQRGDDFLRIHQSSLQQEIIKSEDDISMGICYEFMEGFWHTRLKSLLL